MFQTVRKFQSGSTRGSSSGGGRGGGGGLGGGSIRGTGKSSSKKSFRSHNNTGNIETTVSTTTTQGKSGSTTNKNNNNNDDTPQNDVEQLSWWQKIRAHLKRELWSYVGLLGVFCMYFGVLMCVFALKGVLALPMIMTICGVLLTSVGGSNLFLSWMCYRYQRKKHRRFPSCFCFFGDGDDSSGPASLHPPREKTRPRGHSLAGFLTPEFAKYAEFVARDRRYDNKRYHVLRNYDPSHISISFAHKYWLEQQKPLLQGVGSPVFFPSSDPPSRRKLGSGTGNSDVFPSSTSSSPRKLESRAGNFDVFPSSSSSSSRKPESGAGDSDVFPSSVSSSHRRGQESRARNLQLLPLSVPPSPCKVDSKSEAFFPSSVPASPRRHRRPQSNDSKRKLVKTNSFGRRRKLSS